MAPNSLAETASEFGAILNSPPPLSAPHNHLYAILWTKRKRLHRIWLDLLACYQFKGHALSEGSQEKLSLHHGKVVTNADARTRSERQEGIARQLLLVFRRKTQRIELFRLRKIVRSAMHYIGGDCHPLIFVAHLATDLPIP